MIRKVGLGGGLVLAAGFVLAAGLLGGCSAHDRNLTETGAKAKDYYCAPDAKTADAIEQALRTSDEDEYQDAVRFALAVAPGTNVRILQRVQGDRPKVRVDVLAGTYSGHECWYPDGIAGLLGEK